MPDLLPPHPPLDYKPSIAAHTIVLLFNAYVEHTLTKYSVWLPLQAPAPARFVFCWFVLGICSQYTQRGPNPPVHEDTPPSPSAGRGASKLAIF